MTIALGIDTGGTYTDAVLVDHASGEVLAGDKALTTRHDLSIGIGQAVGVEVIAEQVLADLVGGHLIGDQALHRIDDLRPAAVVEGYVEHDAAVVAGHLQRLQNLAAQRVGDAHQAAAVADLHPIGV